MKTSHGLPKLKRMNWTSKKPDVKSFVIPVDDEKRKLQALKFDLFTDGSCCLQNPNAIPTVASSKFTGPGGWSALVVDSKEKRTVICGGEKDTTNNRMELCAVIKGIEWILAEFDAETAKHVQISVFSDSTYCVNLIRDWLEKWRAIGFASRPNADLLETIDDLVKKCKVKATWVPRCSTENMTLVDKIANDQRLAQ